MKKTISILMIAGALSVATVSTLASLVGPKQIEENLDKKLANWQDKVHLEFIQSAKNGSIEAISNQPGYYKIALQGLNSHVIYFSERPKHITGIVPTQNFFEAWNAGNNNFNSTHPNAVLESEKLQSNNHVFYTFELSNPIYDAVAGKVTYTAKLLSKQQPTLNGKSVIGYTTLFIDDYSMHWHGTIP